MKFGHVYNPNNNKVTTTIHKSSYLKDTNKYVNLRSKFHITYDQVHDENVICLSIHYIGNVYIS